MIRNFISFVLRCRLENVMAVGVSTALAVFFSATHMFHKFNFAKLDLIFIMLPVGILGLKSLLTLLLSSETGEDVDTTRYLMNFFQPFLKILRDWFPFLLLGACYYSLFTNLILRANPHTADAVLSKIDAALLGNQASFLLEPWINPWVTDFLCLVYFSYVFTLPGVALFFYLAGEKMIFRRVMMGYLTLVLMGVTSYLLVPAIGPENFFADQYTRELNGHTVISSVDHIMRVGRVGFDCFPSLHVGIPLLLSFYLRNYRRKLFIPALTYVVLMCCATIYLRYHYVVDVLAAFAFAPAAYLLNDFLLRHWPGERILSSPVQETH